MFLVEVNGQNFGKINLNDPEGFAFKLLNEFLPNGFGTLSKFVIDILVMDLLMAYAYLQKKQQGT
jgi:hypothetical protein